MRITYKLSKVDSRKGEAEVMVRMRHDVENGQTKTGIIVPRANWNEAEGRLNISRRFITPETTRLIELQNSLERLSAHLTEEFIGRTEKVSKTWLKMAVMRFYGECTSEKILIEDVVDDYVRQSDMQKGTARQYKVLKCMLARYRAAGHPMYVGEVTANDVGEFADFLRHEHESDESQGERSQNTINSKLRRLKAVCTWLVTTERCTVNPFNRYKIAEDVYGTPTFLTIEERDALYNYPFESECDREQRDCFVFQCLVGCRVSDLLRLTEDNVTDEGFLQYIQTKLKKSNPITIRVPLTDMAMEIVNRYKGKCNGKLLPVISDCKYNIAIKRVLREAGIDRMVIVQDHQTYEPRLVPICDIASSHMARRTFMANLYKAVKSERTVSAFTGHAKGSLAFRRYTTIDDDMKVDILRQFEEDAHK